MEKTTASYRVTDPILLVFIPRWKKKKRKKKKEKRKIDSN
jgi:hypothetical protein